MKVKVKPKMFDKQRILNLIKKCEWAISFFLGEIELYSHFFFHGKDGYGEIALYNTGLLGVEETLHRYKTGRYSRIPLKIRG